MLDDVVVMVLAGGVGERLYPLTKERAKPAVYFGGPYRIIDFTLSNCINSGLRRIFIALQYKSLSLTRHLRFGWSVVADELGEFVEVLHPQKRVGEHWYQGTADAVYQNLYSIQREGPRHLIVLSGDHVYKMDYARMLRFHQDRGAGATLAVIEVGSEEAHRFGIMQVDEQDRLTGFLEKPRDLPPGGQHLASMGIYIFDCQVLQEMLEAYADDNDFGKAIIPRAIHERKVVSYPFKGYWNDIGTVRSFFDTNLMLTEPKPAFNLFDAQMPLYTNARLLPPAKITRTRVESSIISEGSVVIDSDISHAIIGIRSYLGARTRINRVVMMGADYYRWEDPASRTRVEGPTHPGVDEDSVVERAIIDKNASIGRDCRITNDAGVQEGEGPGFYIRDGIIVIAKNAEIADGTVI